MKKRIQNLFWVVLFCILCTPAIYVQGMDVDDVMSSQLQLFDWESIENTMESLTVDRPDLQTFDLKEEVQNILMGKTEFSLGYLIDKIGNILMKETHTYLSLIIRFALIVILCGFLQTLSSAFKSKDTTKVAFLACYTLIILTISQSLFVIVTLAQQTIDGLSDIVTAALPTLLAFMAVSGYVTSSSALAIVMVGAIELMTFIMQYILLPVIIGLIVLQIVSTMSEEIKIDKFINLFYKSIKYGLRGILMLSLSLMTMYKLTLPYIDVSLKKSALTLSTAFIPVVGDTSRGALEFIMSCAHLLKNSFAVGVVIWIVILAAVPLIKMFGYVALYHIAAAIVQPIGNKKMSDIATVLGKGCQFVLSSTSIVAILSIVVMVVCASVGASIT
ncbi:MAG: stage III sporulation protein AE [Cellulosilyticaceae bacterium]